MDALSWAGRVSWGRPTLHVVAVSPKLSPDIQSLPFCVELITSGQPLRINLYSSTVSLVGRADGYRPTIRMGGGKTENGQGVLWVGGSISEGMPLGFSTVISQMF